MRKQAAAPGTAGDTAHDGARERGHERPHERAHERPHDRPRDSARDSARGSAPRRGTPGLPAYALYGEAGQRQPEQLHCESIAQRSRLHRWEIKPHRHEALFQLLVIATGECRAWLDGQQHTLRGPALVTVPALSAHGFTFSPDVQGHVFTVAEPHLAALLTPHVGLADVVMRPQCAALGDAAADGRAHAPGTPGTPGTPGSQGSQGSQRQQGGQEAQETPLTPTMQGPAAALVDAATALAEATTAGHADHWRGAALDAALLRLAVAVARACQHAFQHALQHAPQHAAQHAGPASANARPASAGNAPPPRALAHVQRLRSMVDAQYRQQPSQAALAALLGITPTQLNRVCQQVLGHSAQAVLHARLLLQAQRELAYTNLAIKQIALELGFVDAAYFTRFFRRLAGTGPAAWRAAQRSGG